MRALRSFLVSRNGIIGRPWLSSALGCALSLSTVGVQAFVLGDAPIHFAPSLAAVTLATLYLSYWSGLTALVTSAIAINYVVLHPHWAWTFSTGAAFATISFLLVGFIVIAELGPLHRRLSSLEDSLTAARKAIASETQLRRATETESQARINDMQSQCENVLALAQSAASAKRFADSMAKRLAVMNAAIAEFPVPVALLHDEQGLPVIHAVSRSMIDLGQNPVNRSRAFLEAIGSIVKVDGDAFEDGQHPLIRATKGTVVYGERVGWLSAAGQLCDARLFAASVAHGQMLAVALVPAAERRVGSFQPN